MLKKTINYDDFDGNAREEVHYFNLTQNELLNVAIKLPNNVMDAVDVGSDQIDEASAVRRLFSALGNNGIYEFIKMLVRESYGRKSADGRRFEKSEEIFNDFAQTLAYDTLLMELISDDKAASDFINGVLPNKVMEQMIQKQKSKPAAFPVV